MSRYIDADKLKKDMCIPVTISYYETVSLVNETIDDQPTADVRKNIKAQKVIGGGEHDGATCWFECGNCHTMVDINDKYCSECGARFES